MTHIQDVATIQYINNWPIIIRYIYTHAAAKVSFHYGMMLTNQNDTIATTVHDPFCI